MRRCILAAGALVATFGDDVELIELLLGAGSDAVNIQVTSLFATQRSYSIVGNGGVNYVNMDDSQSATAPGPSVASAGLGFEFAVVANGTKFVSYQGIDTVNFYRPSGSTVNIANYQSSDYRLNILDGGIHGDFNGDGRWTIVDLDALTLAISQGNPADSSPFDLNQDGFLTTADRDFWLSEAGGLNLGPGVAYLLGDANLDGVVDGSDFGRWNANKFTAAPYWSSGDFNADGLVDGSDFGIWNAHKFTSALAARFNIDFSGLPGADGIPGTPDDIPFGFEDFDTRVIDNEYASAGVTFTGLPTPGQVGGGYNPNGTPNSGTNVVLNGWSPTFQIGPVGVHFANPQTNITFDLFAYLNVSGTSVPVTLRAQGSVVGTRTLTNADAIIGGTTPSQLGGRFRIQSGVPFDEMEIGVSQPSGGGFGIDNLNYSQPPLTQSGSIPTNPVVAQRRASSHAPASAERIPLTEPLEGSRTTIGAPRPMLAGSTKEASSLALLDAWITGTRPPQSLHSESPDAGQARTADRNQLLDQMFAESNAVWRS